MLQIHKDRLKALTNALDRNYGIFAKECEAAVDCLDRELAKFSHTDSHTEAKKVSG